MESKREVYEALQGVLEAANSADAEGCKLPSEWARRDNVFGDVRAAIDKIRPGAVEFWSMLGEWPSLEGTHSCVDCDWTGEVLVPLSETPDLSIRLAPGEIVPEGSCPKCGALIPAKGTLVAWTTSRVPLNRADFGDGQRERQGGLSGYHLWSDRAAARDDALTGNHWLVEVQLAVLSASSAHQQWTDDDLVGDDVESDGSGED